MICPLPALLKYALPRDSRVKITIYDVMGRVVDIPVDEVEVAGYKKVGWNGGAVVSCVYFYKLEAVSVSEAGKSFTQMNMMLLHKIINKRQLIILSTVT